MSVEDTISDLPDSNSSEPVAQGLDTIINDAIEKAETGSIDASQGSGRSRDERGRFAADNSAPDASLEGATEGAATADTGEPDKPAAEQPLEAPSRWSEADKAKFAAWPRDVQEAVIERHKAMEADYTRKTQDIANFRKVAEPLVQAVQPFAEYMQNLSPSLGLSQGEMIQGLLRTEYVLRNGTPEQKAAAFEDIATTYGFDLASFSRGEGGQPDPLINDLRQQVQHLTGRLSSYENQNQQELSRQLHTEVETFKATKNADGTPKFPHFERFKGVMAHALTTGEASTLEEAYELATAPLQEALATELQTRQKTADQQRQEAVTRAKKAGPVVSSGSRPGGSTTGPKGLDAILSTAIDKVGVS